MIAASVIVQLALASAIVQGPAPAEAAPAPATAEAPLAPGGAEQPAPQPVQPAPVFQPAPPPAAPAAPPPEYVPPPAGKTKRRGLGMMISGWSLFAGSYIITALVGAVAYDLGDEQLGGALLIPVAGPLIAIPQADTLSGKVFLVIPFLAQTAGLTLGIAGTVMFARSGRANTALNADGVRLTRSGLRLNAGMSPYGGSVGLRYRF